jgi:hypothetical protein
MFRVQSIRLKELELKVGLPSALLATLSKRSATLPGCDLNRPSDNRVARIVAVRLLEDFAANLLRSVVRRSWIPKAAQAEPQDNWAQGPKGRIHSFRVSPRNAKKQAVEFAPTALVRLAHKKAGLGLAAVTHRATLAFRPTLAATIRARLVNPDGDRNDREATTNECTHQPLLTCLIDFHRCHCLR